jgi:hypothetical protein
MASYIAMGVAALLLVVFLYLTIKNGRSKKYRVTTAEMGRDGGLVVLDVTRRWNDGWSDTKEMKVYHQNDKRIILSTHWIIKIEEV